MGEEEALRGWSLVSTNGRVDEAKTADGLCPAQPRPRTTSLGETNTPRDLVGRNPPTPRGAEQAAKMRETQKHVLPLS